MRGFLCRQLLQAPNRLGHFRRGCRSFGRLKFPLRFIFFFFLGRLPVSVCVCVCGLVEGLQLVSYCPFCCVSAIKLTTFSSIAIGKLSYKLLFSHCRVYSGCLREQYIMKLQPRMVGLVRAEQGPFQCYSYGCFWALQQKRNRHVFECRVTSIQGVKTDL